MRKPVWSWKTILARLGRAWRKKPDDGANRRTRRLLLETMEPRRLMSVVVEALPLASSTSKDTNPAQVAICSPAGPVSQDLTVVFSISGDTNTNNVRISADSGYQLNLPTYSDGYGDTYYAGTGSVTIPDSASAATVTIESLTESAASSDQVTLTLLTPSSSASSGADYTLDRSSQATVTILNDQQPVVAPTVEVTPATQSTGENGPAAAVAISLESGPASQPVTVDFTLSGSAASGDFQISDGGSYGLNYDYWGNPGSGGGSGYVTIPAGVSQVTLAIGSLTEPPASEQVTLALQSDSEGSYQVDENNSAATVTIVNDEPVVEVTPASQSTGENSPRAQVTFTNKGSTAESLTVNFAVSGDAYSGFSMYVADGCGLTYNGWGATGSGSVTIPAGSSQATVTVWNWYEPLAAEQVVFALEPADGSGGSGAAYQLDGASQATVTIVNDTPPEPMVEVTPAWQSTGENGAAAEVLISLESGAASQPVTVDFSLSGAATGDFQISDGGSYGLNYDYSGNGSLTIPAGVSQAMLTVRALTEPSASEQVTVALQSNSDGSYQVDASNSAATVTISNDAPLVGVMPASQTTNENGSQAQVAIALESGPASQSVTVDFALSGDTNAGDFRISGSSYGLDLPTYSDIFGDTYYSDSGSVTIPAGATAATLMVQSLTEPSASESVTFVLQAPAGSGFSGTVYEVDGSHGAATVTVDGPPMVAVTPATQSTSENGSSAEVTISLESGPASQSVTIDFSLGGNANASGYQLSTSGYQFWQSGSSGWVTIPAGASQATVTIQSLTEPSGSEWVTFTLQGPAASCSDPVYEVDGNYSTATVTIVDDPPVVVAPTVEVTPDTQSTGENGAAAAVTISLEHGPVSQSVTVDFTLSGSAVSGDFQISDGGSYALNYDYWGSPGTGAGFGYVTIPAGASAVTLAVESMTEPPGSEQVTLDLQSSSEGSYQVDDNNSAATVTIVNDTPVVVAPVVEVTPASQSTGENSSPAQVTFTNLGSTAQSLTVNFAVSGDAYSGFYMSVADGCGLTYNGWGATGYGSVTIPAGSSQATVTIDGAEPPAAEQVVFTLEPAGGSGSSAAYQLDGASQATVTIVNDEPVVEVAAAQPTTGENSPPAEVTFTNVNRACDQSVTVSFALSGAAAGGDFQISDGGSYGLTYGNWGNTGSVTIPAGESQATLTIQALAEPAASEQVTFTLTGSNDQATVTIVNDGPTFEVTPGSQSTSENSSSAAEVTISAESGPLSQSAIVYFLLSGDTNTDDLQISDGGSYGLWLPTCSDGSGTCYSGPGSVTIPAGASAATVTIRASTEPFASEQATLTLLASGSIGTAYNVDGNNGAATVSIVHDGPIVEVTPGQQWTTENGSSAEVTISLESGATSQPMTVWFSLGGDAPSGDYFVAGNDVTYSGGSGTVTIPAYQSAATITIEALTEPAASESVTFTLLPSNGSDYSDTAYGEDGANGAATVTILNDAPTVTAPASTAPGTEDPKTASLSALGADVDAPPATLTYTWTTTGTPPAPVSFSSVNGTNAGQNTTATFGAAGTYGFLVTITGPAGLSVTSSVNLTVDQTLTSIAVDPSNVSLGAAATQQFTAVGYDQFGNAMTTQPTFTWTTTTVGGTVNSSGLFAAPAATAGGTVTATCGSLASDGAVSVQPVDHGPTVSLSAGGAATEGTNYAVSLYASEPGHDLVGGSWTLDWGDGQTSSGGITAGTTWPLSIPHDYCDDYGDRLLTATVTDATGQTGTAYQWLPLADVATSLSISVASPQYAVAGNTLTLNDLATYSDPGFAPGGQLYYTIDWGDGSGAVGPMPISGSSPGPTTGTLSGSHEYYSTGIFTVRVEMFDNNGSPVTGSFQVNVSSPPTLSVSTATSMEGYATILQGTISSLKSVGYASATINWGDGTGDQSLGLAAGATSFVATHQYPPNNQGLHPYRYSPQITIVLADAYLMASHKDQVCMASTTVNIVDAPLGVKLFESGDGSGVFADVYNPGAETLTYDWSVIDMKTQDSIDVGNESSFPLNPASDGYMIAVQVTKADGDTASDSGIIFPADDYGTTHQSMPVDGTENEPTVTITAGGPDPVIAGGMTSFTITPSSLPEHEAYVGYDAPATPLNPTVSGTYCIPPSWYNGPSWSNGTIPVQTINGLSDASTTTGLVTMMLTGAEGVTLANDSASVTVDLTQPVVNVWPASPVIAGQPVIFEVTLSAAVGYAVSVGYDFTDGTAHAGVDYDGTGGTVCIPAGATSADIVVPTMQDPKVSDDIYFTVHLESAVGATLGTRAAQGTITHVQPPAVSIDNVTVDAGDTAEFTVTLSPPEDHPVAIQFYTQDGSAKAGTNYYGTTIAGTADVSPGAVRTLWFFPGQVSATIPVPTIEAGGLASKDFQVVLENYPGAVTGSPVTGTGTILNTDTIETDGTTILAAGRNACSGPVAEFRVAVGSSSGGPTPPANADDFTAMVDWGDGSQSDGEVEAGSGDEFVVDASHAYDHEGPYAVTVEISSDEYGTGIAASYAYLCPCQLAVADFLSAGRAGWRGYGLRRVGGGPGAFSAAV